MYTDSSSNYNINSDNDIHKTISHENYHNSIKKENSSKNTFGYFIEDFEGFFFSKIFLILILINIRFSSPVIFLSILCLNIVNIIINSNIRYLNFIIINNFTLKIISSLFFLILGLKYILDNTRFSIKENSSMNRNEIKVSTEYSDDNYSNICEEIKIVKKDFQNKKRSNNINSSNCDDDSLIENEKSFIFNKNKVSNINQTKIFGIELDKILLEFENLLFCIIALIFSGFLDKTNLFLNTKILIKVIFYESSKYNNIYLEEIKELKGNILNCIISYSIIIIISLFAKKFVGKKSIIFYYGFLILFYFGIYSIYNTILYKESYLKWKIMLSRQMEKTNPNVFLKKKDLETHFINNNSKILKKKILEKKLNKLSINNVEK